MSTWSSTGRLKCNATALCSGGARSSCQCTAVGDGRAWLCANSIWSLSLSCRPWPVLMQLPFMAPQLCWSSPARPEAPRKSTLTLWTASSGCWVLRFVKPTYVPGTHSECGCVSTGACGCVFPCAVWRFLEERLLTRRTTCWHKCTCGIRQNRKQHQTCYVVTMGPNGKGPMPLGACAAWFDASWKPTDSVERFFCSRIPARSCWTAMTSLRTRSPTAKKR